MKILVPVNDVKSVDKYISAGADEMYLGFHDEKWISRFGIYSDINRMSGFAERANSFSFEALLDIIKEIKFKGKRIYITFNANEYSYEQVCYIKENYFLPLKTADVDGVILSDINLIHQATDVGLAPVASTMCAVYNEDIAEVYRNFGVRRMILPRDLNLSEIKAICEKMPDVHFEAFFMRNGCVFSDSYCLGFHRPECGATCTYTRYCARNYVHDYKKFKDYNAVEVNDYLYRTAFHIEACAMCALYRLRSIGIKSLKIVGRADEVESVCKDIELTKRNIEIMEDSSNENEYLERMIFPDNFPQKCRGGLSCYYPEIRFES